MFCAFTCPNQTDFIHTRSKKTLFSCEREKSENDALTSSVKIIWKCLVIPSTAVGVEKSKHLFNSLELLFVYCADKVCDCVWWRWIVQNYESLVRTVKWSGWGVGGVWRSFIIHEMGGQSVSGSDRQKLYYWSVSTPLGFLTWYLEDWGINWYTAQTRIISWRKAIGIIDALGEPQRWGGESPDLTL